MLPEGVDQLEALNRAIRSFVNMAPDRVKIFDWDAHVQKFQAKQQERGKFGRSLFSEASKPTSLCVTLLSMFLEDCILRELK